MIRHSFNDGWTAGPKPSLFGEPKAGRPRETVRLPHDGVRDLDRSPESSNGSHTGYYPGAHLSYEKSFDVPNDWRHKAAVLEFEGVYRDAQVYVNDHLAGQRPSGYAAFEIRLEPFLRFGESNRIRVEARTHEDSRWYSGGGIYRNTWLALSDPVHLALNGIRVTTPDIDAERAVVIARLPVANETRHTRTVRLTTRIVGPDGTQAASASAPITLLPHQAGAIHLRHYVSSPMLWSVETPALYTLHTALYDDDVLLDEDETAFGIRSIQLDPIHGLRINGETVNLRGGCVHHDNGPLGSAAISRAEERRVEILKSAGYNAIRSAHNTISRAFLDACDRLGMLVIDEFSDVWTRAKNSFDYSLDFPEWWERDIESMVEKDFNHPSVIMYSIGNEIPEVGQPLGAAWGRQLAEKVRELDSTRLVTNAINNLVSAMEMFAPPTDDGGVDVNAMIDGIEGVLDAAASNPAVTARTEEAESQLDAIGINYAEVRYGLEAQLRPAHIVYGSETFPGALDRLWPLVNRYPTVIGDFAWTAWDYMGEAGIGRVVYRGDEPGGFAAAFPHLTAGSGTIDITGHLRPIAYWRQVVWGLRSVPYIAVRRPQRHGHEVRVGAWSWPDVVSSWSWDVPEGSPTVVDVYCDADEVELLLDGKSIGRASVGETKAFIATFDVLYVPGTLTAVAYRGTEEVGRTSLSSAVGSLQLRAETDRSTVRASGDDLAFVTISIVDPSGIVANDVSAQVTLDVDGPAEIVGFASAAPSTTERFDDSCRTTHDGRVLAVIRPTAAGTITVSASADGLAAAAVIVEAVDLPAGGRADQLR